MAHLRKQKFVTQKRKKFHTPSLVECALKSILKQQLKFYMLAHLLQVGYVDNKTTKLCIFFTILHKWPVKIVRMKKGIGTFSFRYRKAISRNCSSTTSATHAVRLRRDSGNLTNTYQLIIKLYFFHISACFLNTYVACGMAQLELT